MLSIVISTHITEVGAALAETDARVRFSYLPTLMEGPIARYTYLLRDGISNDRHGMTIIRQEGILELIDAGKT